MYPSLEETALTSTLSAIVKDIVIEALKIRMVGVLSLEACNLQTLLSKVKQESF